jgi:putative ABC transport system permease protein
LTVVLLMNGIYRGNIEDGVWLIENTATDLWVVEGGRGGPFNESSRMPLDSHKSVAATPGVQIASPMVIYTAQRRLGGSSASQQFTVIGYDVFGGLGGPGRLVQGRALKAAHREMVADGKLGLALGEVVTLGNDRYRVVGLTRGAVDASGNPLVYLSLPDAQKVQFEQDTHAAVAGRAAALRQLEIQGVREAQAQALLPLVTGTASTVNAVLVRLAPGAQPPAVARHVQDWLHFNVYTTQQERAMMLEGRLSRMSAVLGLFRGLLVLVSLVIIALIVYVLTIEKIRSIATLKLIGAPNHLIVRLIVTQALLLTLGGFAVAYVLREIVAPGFPRTLAFTDFETGTTFVVMLLGGVLASLLAIWHALRTPAQLALGS